MAYATVEQVEAGFRALDADEKARVEALLDEASIIIDHYNFDAENANKRLVSCRMVRRSIGDGDSFPMGASQGSMSAGGYTQSWTMGSNGTSGELYLSKTEKALLGVGNKIASRSPLEEIAGCCRD